MLLSPNLNEIYEKYGDKLKRDHVRSLEEWLEKQPHLPKLKEMYLMQFLHSANYNNERAKMLIDNFCTMWTHFPDVFSERSPEKIKDIFDMVSIVLLPNLTPAGEHIILVRNIAPVSSKYIFQHYLQYIDMFISMNKERIGLWYRQRLVIDAKDYTLAHMTKTNFVALKKFIQYVQDGLPHAINAVHFINLNPIMEKVIQTVQPFLRSELFKLVRFHKTLEDFFTEIPVDIFPVEYGGSEISVEKLHEQQKKEFFDNADFFKNEQFLADESKRPGKPKSENDIFGIEGTFKKLSID